MTTTNNIETEKAPVERSGSFLAKLIDSVTLTTNARMIYGDPVERDGVTVIPVGKVLWGLGGGESGGGSGVGVSPVGYIEIKNSTARFKPIFDPALIVQIISASAFASLVVLTGVRGVIRIARKK